MTDVKNLKDKEPIYIDNNISDHLKDLIVFIKKHDKMLYETEECRKLDKYRNFTYNEAISEPLNRNEKPSPEIRVFKETCMRALSNLRKTATQLNCKEEIINEIDYAMSKIQKERKD